MMRILTAAWFGALVLALIMSGAIPSSLLTQRDESSLRHSSGMSARVESVITGKVLVVAMSSDVETMDPSKTSAMYGPPGMVLETLVTRDKTGAYQPGLADSYAWNLSDPNNPRFVIHLKQGVVFQDGTPFNAQAVKDDVMWYKQSDMAGSYGWVAYEFAAIDCSNGTSDWGDMDKGIWVQDDYNLVFNCTFYDSALIFNLSHLYGSMMSPTAAYGSGATLDEAHLNYGTPSHPAVGTGPFEITEWVPGDHVTLVKFNNYSWGFDWYVNKGPAKIDTIIYRIILDEATRLAAFENRSVDVLMQVPPGKIQGYAADPSLNVITAPGQGVYYIEFNCQKAPWTSVDLRRAIGFAINRTEIVNVVWHGYASPGANYLPPILPEGALIPPQYNYSFNLTKAMQLFAAAGWVKNGNGWLENTTTNVELTLPLWTTNKGADIMMSEMLHSQLEAAGVHVTLTQYAEDALRFLAAAGMDDSMLFSDSWPRAEILDWHFGSWAANGGSNTAQYLDAIFDAYVSNWTYAQSDSAFSENATLAHERLLTMGPWAPIVFWQQIAAVHNYVTGWYLNPVGQEQVIDGVDVDVNAPPHALALVTPNPAAPGAIVTLDASTSSDDVGIVNWSWSFSDGGIPVSLWGETATYTLSNGIQDIDVTLTVRDGFGNTDSTVVTLQVTNAIPEFHTILLPILGTMSMIAFIGLSNRRRHCTRNS
jgi:ABC-type transport system substrate-binding protein